MTVKEMGAARRMLGGLLFGAEPALRKIGVSALLNIWDWDGYGPRHNAPKRTAPEGAAVMMVAVGMLYTFLRRRRIKPNPISAVPKIASEAGSGTAVAGTLFSRMAGAPLSSA